MQARSKGCNALQALSTLWLGDGTFGHTSIAWDGWRGVFVQTRADNATFLQARCTRAFGSLHVQDTRALHE